MTLPNFEIVCHTLQVMDVSKLIVVIVHCDRTLRYTWFHTMAILKMGTIHW